MVKPRLLKFNFEVEIILRTPDKFLGKFYYCRSTWQRFGGYNKNNNTSNRQPVDNNNNNNMANDLR
jgi:hypothetical protein